MSRSTEFSVCFLHPHEFTVSLQHPDYREEEPPDWLVDVPDPALADEWEMLSFYRFVEIDQPEAYANVLQVRDGGVIPRGFASFFTCRAALHMTVYA